MSEYERIIAEALSKHRLIIHDFCDSSECGDVVIKHVPHCTAFLIQQVLQDVLQKGVEVGKDIMQRVHATMQLKDASVTDYALGELAERKRILSILRTKPAEYCETVGDLLDYFEQQITQIQERH